MTPMARMGVGARRLKEEETKGLLPALKTYKLIDLKLRAIRHKSYDRRPEVNRNEV